MQTIKKIFKKDKTANNKQIPLPSDFHALTANFEEEQSF